MAPRHQSRQHAVRRVAQRAREHRKLRDDLQRRAADARERSGPHQEHDAHKSQNESTGAVARHALALYEAVRQHQRHQGHRRHEYAGERAVHRLLSPHDHVERDAVADQGENEIGKPRAAKGRKTQAPRVDHCKEDQRADREPARDERCRRHGGDAELIEHERRTPHRDKRKQECPVFQGAGLHEKVDRGVVVPTACARIHDGRTQEYATAYAARRFS